MPILTMMTRWLFILALVLGFAVPALAVEITISCGSVLSKEGQLCQQEVNAWAQKTGNTVKVTNPPDKTNERYFKYLIALGDADPSVDVYQIDVIWTGLMARFFVDLKKYFSEEDIQKHFPAIIKNNTVDGRLVGMPWFTDAGILYYRKDLLEKYGFSVPTEWSQLTDMALYIQTQERKAGNKDLWGYVFQGGPYEGLTCDALEWINAYGGGTIVDADGNVTVDNPQAVVAIARAAGWINTISPSWVVAADEVRSANSFKLGNAVFMRNWPFVWAELNSSDSPVAGKVDLAPLPKGGFEGHSASTLGGWQLAVSKFSKNPDVAADLVRYLTSEEVQKQRAIEGSYAPTIKGLYEDPDVLKATPFFSQLPQILEHAVARPSSQTGQSYMAVSTHVWDTVNRILQGAQSAQDGLSSLQDQLRLIKFRADEAGGW